MPKDPPYDRLGAERATPPLTLYVHLPWCVRKCPYCDFNSHPARQPPFAAYVERLLLDLGHELREPAARRTIQAIYIGGGTPSLFPGWAIRRLLAGIRDQIELAPDAEITLEANPGTLDLRRLADYREAGVNRLSLGVQSLSAKSLRRLGRIHTPDEARIAVQMARDAGFDNINLDLMFGLPEQGLLDALADLDEALALAPEHLSYYQLTLEPETAFAASPPFLPDPDLVAEMGAAGSERLESAGYRRYEVSAYAQPGYACRHNLNYWRFGDYLGIGAGAHGKLTVCRDPGGPWQVWRTEKAADPALYLGAGPMQIGTRRLLTEADLIGEFALNAFRLTHGFTPALFTATTGLPWSRLVPYLESASRAGLLRLAPESVVPTPLGRDFLDDLIGHFLDPRV